MVRVFQADGYAAARAKQFSLHGKDPTGVSNPRDGSQVWEGSTIKYEVCVGFGSASVEDNVESKSMCSDGL